MLLGLYGALLGDALLLFPSWLPLGILAVLDGGAVEGAVVGAAEGAIGGALANLLHGGVILQLLLPLPGGVLLPGSVLPLTLPGGILLLGSVFLLLLPGSLLLPNIGLLLPLP